MNYEELTELADMIADRLHKLSNEDAILTQPEAANYLGCSVRQLQRYQVEGLKYVPGRPPRFFLRDLKDYLKNQRI